MNDDPNPPPEPTLGHPADHPLDAALRALPARMPDALVAERLRLRARLDLASARRRHPLGRAWDVVEPFVATAAVVAFLVWSVQQVSIVLG